MKYLLRLRSIAVAILLFSATISGALAQYSIQGTVTSADGPLPYANVVLADSVVIQTDSAGAFRFEYLPKGTYTIEVSYLGYSAVLQSVMVPTGAPLEVVLSADEVVFDEVVVTGTRTFKRQTESAVIVHVVDSKKLRQVQACNLSEGLRFQPGLRVENNCQTCGYTQLRMNGLGGGYSQILINGRPIFSPLTGLYGLEQIPVNMIDRIEVVRGGGSSLYGSSAIGGTVNVLTKIPTGNSLSVNTTYQNVNGGASDAILSGNGTYVSDSGKAGVSLFVNRRDRQAYDHNGDNFSELPELRNTSVGASAFWLPTPNQKIELSMAHLKEYRYGGDLVDVPAVYLAQQAEERNHSVWMGSADYQINSQDRKSSLIGYAALQHTGRDHYTGVLPDSSDLQALTDHVATPPYGVSATTTLQLGVQANHELGPLLGGVNVLTLGLEYLKDDTYDEIPAYDYLIDQLTTDLGVFVQSDWELTPSLTLLSGVRVDKHNLVDGLVASPRLSLLYRYGSGTQLRASYGSGFRAPQAFDSDLHIAFAGGGVSRVILAEDLTREESDSYSLSINYDRPTEHWVAGFTVEAFHTKLRDAFALIPVGEDAFGEVFEKRNDQGATVAGGTLELRANYDQKVQLETGLTLQTSRFDNEIAYIEEVAGTRRFIRTPDSYGFATLSLTPSSRFSANINYVYTGSMVVPHFAGAPTQLVDEMVDTPSFSEVSCRLGYRVPSGKGTVEFYGGVKNIFDSYQADFGIGRNRDSNYVYGPSLPRTLYIGVQYNL